MLHSTADHKAVTCANIKLLTGAANFQMTRDHINDLFLKMTMRRTDPAPFHAVLGEKQLVVIGAEATREACFRFALFKFRTSDEGKISSRLVHSAHLQLLPKY